MKQTIVWITGASSGIGEELAYGYSKLGATVVLSARREGELQRVQSQCANPEKTLIVPLDLAQNETFEAAVQKVISAFGQIDLLINNGGISQRETAANTSLEVDRRVMEVNYFGNIALTKAVLPHMQQRKEGHLVTISSISGKFGFFNRSAYAASKHALHGFYESLRLEEIPNNIKVSIVLPGPIQTNISLHAVDGTGQQHGQMDPMQLQGMPADECAAKIIAGIAKAKEEILVGKKEIKAVLLKRLAPRLFSKIIRKQKP